MKILKFLKFFLYYISWVIIQWFVLGSLYDIRFGPSNLIAAPPLRGITVLLFSGNLWLIILIYTLVGLIILLKHGINTKQWWKKISVWYLVYALISSLGMLWVMKAWFWEGYGLYLIDVLCLPLLWLLELELCLWMNPKKIRTDTINRIQS